MDNTILIREATFQAELLPDQLARLPSRQLVRLFVIMLLNSYLEENNTSIKKLTDWLPEALSITKAKWEQANREYEKGWRKIGELCLITPEIQAQKDLNRQLTSTVRRTRDCYKDIQKIQKCFNEAQNYHKRRNNHG
ncbi:MAG: hypothetical protein VB064_12980 [Oscillospiraceae bacterium]|nr:hypothetical protein [Oscillospiraceae bacterium]